MRPTFTVDSEGHPKSALVPDGEPEVLQVGMRVRIDKDIDLTPHTHVHSGERGVIAHVDRFSGMVEIKLEEMHWGLALWHNCMWIVPFESEEHHAAVTCV